MSQENKLICPLCWNDVVISRHNNRDWASITCYNPNCLKPSTGWGTESMITAFWLKFSKGRQHAENN